LNTFAEPGIGATKPFQMNTQPLVSVVIVTYKRLDLLSETIESLLSVSSYPRERLELILCDDGSGQKIQSEMRMLPCDVFLFSKKNRGMGANTNAGLRAARGDFILHLQDDWRCVGPSDFIEASLEVLSERPDVGAIRLRGPLGEGAKFESYSTASGHRKVDIYPTVAKPERFVYSDNPHLKRRRFHHDLGYYLEGVPMTVAELDFCARFASQTRWKFAWLQGYSVFEHTGEEQTFNPSVRLRKKVEAIERLWLGPAALHTFRWVRNQVARRA
jgi:GT2 family glycosyltransferase